MGAVHALQRCAFCSRRAEGNFSVHRDGFCIGPEVELCDHCGLYPTPSLPEIWAKIGQASECERCDKPFAEGEERSGSHHVACFEELVS